MDHAPWGLVPPSGEAGKKSPGRPKGAKNKAGGDLAKWFTATTGSTPGQELLNLVAVTAKDVRLAREWGKSQQRVTVNGEGLDLRAIHPRTLALTWKAHNFARLNGITLGEAWAMMFKGIDILMPFMHQKQGAVEPVAQDKRAVIYADGTPLGALGNPSQAVELQGEISFGPPPLTQQGSHKAE